jgi:hypothetical protein
VDVDVGAALFWRDEAKALVRSEHFHCALRHLGAPPALTGLDRKLPGECPGIVIG